MISNVKHIIKRTWTHKREISFIYLCQLMFGLIVGFTFCTIICNNIGDSIALEDLAKGFDRTVFMDVLNNNDDALGPLKTIIIILAPLYILISVGLHGGLLSNINYGVTGIKKQIQSGLKNYFPFLAISLISILLIALFGLLIGLPFARYVGDPLVTFSSEKPFVWSLILILGFFSLWTILVWSWSIGCRYAYLEERGFMTSLKAGLKFVFNNLGKILLIGFLILGLHIALGIVYTDMMEDRGASSWMMVFLSIMVQQIFSFVRVLIRGLGYVTLGQIDETHYTDTPVL